MAIFLKSGEIKSTLGALVKYYIQECNTTGQIPQEFIELIKHNFLAKYVYFNKKDHAIEVGINESKRRTTLYPEIKIYSFPLDQTTDWLEESFKSGKADLEFYGKLINANTGYDSMEVVVV
ncbi:hypothetical protein GCM10007103_10600 [Salinimicrobium marinum]|uniref:Uncharacterized protein n=1 Tax=Salinimicrobium marinum TaxID=680283 RepID=A0A918SBL1_9FLAO|nr:hypothetical protein [Salinimicrobium marinum]GHA30935.1 hypothetical protein GCM10007103_10600 [Salinimicrobium marinum]